MFRKKKKQKKKTQDKKSKILIIMCFVENFPVFLYNNGNLTDINTEDITMANVKELLKAEENGSLLLEIIVSHKRQSLMIFHLKAIHIK